MKDMIYYYLFPGGDIGYIGPHFLAGHADRDIPNENELVSTTKQLVHYKTYQNR